MSSAFKIQRGSGIMSSGSATLTITSGVDFTAPTSSTFFFRISNSMYTGMGKTSGGGSQNVDDFTSWISSESASSVTFSRYGTSNDNRIDWELIEYIGAVGGDNEIEVQKYIITLPSAIPTSTQSISEVSGNSAIWITGQASASNGRNNAGSLLHTVTFNSTTEVQAQSQASTVERKVSIAVVDFIGSNWTVDSYLAEYTGRPTNVTITSRAMVNTFILKHWRYNVATSGLDDSSVRVSMTTDTNIELYNTSTATGNKFAQLYVISNPDITVDRYGATMSGTEEEEIFNQVITSVTSEETLLNMSNDSTGSGTAFPRGAINYTLSAEDNVLLRQSDNGQTSIYRLEVITLPQDIGAIVPEFNITNTPITKISDEITVDSCLVEFSCTNTDIDSWEARATTDAQTPSQGVGLLVGSGSSVLQNVTASFNVDDEELTGGDREYTITIYVQSGGVWYG